MNQLRCDRLQKVRLICVILFEEVLERKLILSNCYFGGYSLLQF